MTDPGVDLVSGERTNARAVRHPDEFRHCTQKAVDGTVWIRSFSDAALLAVARSPQHQAFRSPELRATLDRLGPATNPAWARARAAEEAYNRGLIDEAELDALTG